MRVDRSAARARVCFVIESGTDVRTVDGMAERFDLTILARRIPDGVEISQPPKQHIDLIVGPASRARFAALTAKFLYQHRGSFDYVVAQGYGLTALIANLLSRVTGMPTAMLIVSPVEAYYRCRKSNPHPGKPFRIWELKTFELLAGLNGRLGRRYLVPSHHLGDTVRASGTSSPIDYVPIYGVDVEVFRPSTESMESLRARRGLPETGSIVFFSSRIAPEKDSHALLAAIGILLRKGRDVWLLHRSGGYQAFQREAERMGVAQRVIATDAVHPLLELPLDYQCSNVCVQASREEGLGFSPLEAMACGVPVVASAVGGLKETVIDGRTGWSYPVGDAEALASRIEQILDDPAEASRRSREALKFVRAQFERNNAFDRLEAVISDDIQQSAQSRLAT